MNQYHIYEAIGRGDRSVVYKGRKKKSIDYYAIKCVEKILKNKVLQEVRTLHFLEHPNVLKFYAWYETSNHLWLILEYCVGGDLATLLKQDTRLPEESVHDFARDVAEALQSIHSKGVVYCDVKPSNLLLDQNGRIKLCDFGLSRKLADISKNSIQQLPQAKRGTPAYMAPELFQGGVHSFASDLWALGCVMYECYVGTSPFASSSFKQMVESILNDPVPPLNPSTDKDFQDLVTRLLVKDPAERIKWPEIRDHAFWKKKLKPLSLPSQPAFQKYLDSMKTSSESQDSTETLRNGGSGPKQVVKKHKAENVANGKTPPGRRPASAGPLTEVSGRANAVVNVLRLSKIVKTNLQREAEGNSYRQQNAKAAADDSDLTLENNDQELDFAERPDADGEAEDEESVSVSESTNNEENVVAEDGNADSNGKEIDVEEVRLEALRMEVAATPPGVGIPRKAQRIAALTGEKKKATPAFKAEDHPKASTMLSQALWHPSDLAVRPIMQNRKADPAGDSRFDGKALPVDSLSSTDFLKLQPEEREGFCSRITASVCGNTSVNEKVNTLKYLETISVSMDAANVLVNGAMMHSLVKLLRTTKLPALRVQLTSAIGLLVRNATLIEDDLASSGIIAVLTETLRDKQEKVRRCAMASLGELLFFVATQHARSPRSAAQENAIKEGKSSVWQVPSTTIALVASVLRKGEDDVTQHYALKAIENISSQGGEWSARFTTHDVLSNLCYVLKSSSKPETFRSTAGSCLVRLVRFSPSSVSVVLEKVTFKELIAGLVKGSAKLQQVYINLLNIALVGSSVMSNPSKHLQILFDEKALIPNIMAILEQGPEVLRGKAFVSAALLCKINRKWMLSFCNAKLLPAVERLAKEKDAYVQQCVDALVQIVVSVVPGILESIGVDFQHSASGNKRPSSATSPHPTPGRSQARGSLPLFPVVLHLFRSSIFRERIVNEQVLQQLAGFLKRIEAVTNQGQDDFQTTLLRIIESISQQPSILLNHQEIFITQFLPNLATLYRKNSCGDTRFLCLKVFCDILLVIMDDMAEQSRDNSRQKQMRMIIKQYFLPLYPVLLEDEDPIPMYAQKLLVMLLDLRCIDINDILQLKIVSQFFEFLREDLSTVNLHNVRLCLFLVSSQEVETAVISQLHVVNRLVSLLEFVHLNGMEDFLDPTLSVCRLLLIRNAGKLKNSGISSSSSGSGSTNNGFRVGSEHQIGGSAIQDIGGFSRRAKLFVELCRNLEPRIAETASECLILAVKAAPRLAAPSILSGVQELGKVLEKSTACGHGSALLSLLQRRLLQALAMACKEQRLADSGEVCWPSGAVISSLENVVLRLRKSSLPQVADAAVDAALELQILTGRT